MCSVEKKPTTIREAIERYAASWGKCNTKLDFHDPTHVKLFASECAREVEKVIKAKVIERG